MFDFMCGITQRFNRQQFGLKRPEEEAIVKSHVLDLKTQGSNSGPLGTRRLICPFIYATIHLYKLMSFYD